MARSNKTKATVIRAMTKVAGRWFSAFVVNPLSDLKSFSIRLRTFRLLRKTQWLSREQLLAWQRERLSTIVAHAGRHSPYYRNVFEMQGFDAAKFTLDEFRRLPLLEKQTIRHETRNLLVDNAVRERLVEAKTGGSTGMALTIYFDIRWQERRNADAMRSDEWAGWRLGMQKGAVWGNPAAPAGWYARFKDRWLYCEDLFLDTMNITPATMDAFVDQWNRRGIDVLFGHAHSLYILADYLKSKGGDGLRPTGIIATSMMLLENERKVIEAVFKCPVTNRYGCEEVGLIACECEQHRGMHLNIEHLYVEFLREDGSPAEPGETGEIVITDLFNRAMPLIRYRVGDVGVYSTRSCECGRGLPMLDNLVGRTADFLKRRDGSRVAGVSLVERTLTAIPGLAQMQLVQTALDCIDVNLVRADDYQDSSGDELINEIKAVFGKDITVKLNFFDSIPREASGKYRFAKCLV